MILTPQGMFPDRYDIRKVYRISDTYTRAYVVFVHIKIRTSRGPLYPTLSAVGPLKRCSTRPVARSIISASDVREPVYSVPSAADI